MNDLFYLKPNIVIEPLFNRWYCWSHLISPATAAMNVKYRHLKIMSSYIQAPQAHRSAVMNPKMLGGPFMDYPSLRREDVSQLKEETIKKQSKLIEFAEAITDLNQLLQKEAKGLSLDSFYAKVPKVLKGYVELVYDLNNHPTFRIFESLLYMSPIYDEGMQSIALWEANNDNRSFVLSTPRLDDEKTVHITLPFRSTILGQLAKMKRSPGSFNEIAEQLKIKDNNIFKSFFTSVPPPQYARYMGEAIRMRYFGHACILIESKDVSILVDPLISYYGFDSEINHFSDIHLPDVIDYVLITHNHQDHILLETLLPLRHKIKNVIVPRGGNNSLQDPNLKLMLKNIGFENVIEIADLEEVKFSDCIITGVPFIGEHADLDVLTKRCHHVQIGEFSMLFVADSCNIEPTLYEHVHDYLGDIDVIFLGMECEGAPLTWVYGPYFTDNVPREFDQSRRLSGSNFERGIALIEIFNPREAYVYAMGMEPWLKFISSIKYTEESIPIIESTKLVEACRARNVISERLYGEKEILYSKVNTGRVKL